MTVFFSSTTVFFCYISQKEYIVCSNISHVILSSMKAWLRTLCLASLTTIPLLLFLLFVYCVHLTKCTVYNQSTQLYHTAQCTRLGVWDRIDYSCYKSHFQSYHLYYNICIKNKDSLQVLLPFPVLV